MKETTQINNLLINSIIEDKDTITYELKLLDPSSEEINITYHKNEGRYSDDGYTLYHIAAIRNAEAKKGVTKELYGQIKSIANKFGVNLLDSELTILNGSDGPNARHYEMATLLNCIISINALFRFTNLFE